jgi:hypothetical protein
MALYLGINLLCVNYHKIGKPNMEDKIKLFIFPETNVYLGCEWG